ncbi:hypothetical protein NKI95_32210 [Mesorhizobium sp. M0306]|uniref:hypothetical protein n=1 Tax=Mesorhizobium sp. M0306 TaxID=2956932 RepID=UPI003338EBE0
MSSVAAEITFTLSRIRPSKTTLEVAVAPGGRSLRYVALHVRDDKLVACGWPARSGSRAGAKLGGRNIRGDRELAGGGRTLSGKVTCMKGKVSSVWLTGGKTGSGGDAGASPSMMPNAFGNLSELFGPCA